MGTADHFYFNFASLKIFCLYIFVLFLYFHDFVSDISSVVNTVDSYGLLIL